LVKNGAIAQSAWPILHFAVEPGYHRAVRQETGDLRLDLP
jgi:hypothetical protein